MMHRAYPRLSILFIMAFLLGACSAQSPTPETPQPPTETATAFVMQPKNTPTNTENPVASLEATADSLATPVVKAPDNSSDAPVAETPTDSATLPTAKTAPPPVRSTGPICNNALFIDDVTIPDGSIVAPGKAFTKTWRVKNFGACRWNTSYTLGFAYGSKLAGVETKLPNFVDPGYTVDISVTLTAPKENGWYGGWWRLKSDTGVNFGDFVYVSIQVTAGIASTTPTP
jgi:hypothetical protein